MTTSDYAAQRMRANPADLRHGTANGYGNLKCRCAPCTTAWTEYCKHRTGEQAQRQGAS